MKIQLTRVQFWSIVAAAVLFVAFVWPTPYRYEHAGSTLIRVNRFTGKAHRVWDGSSARTFYRW
jgi:hypothetical protein